MQPLEVSSRSQLLSSSNGSKQGKYGKPCRFMALLAICVSLTIIVTLCILYIHPSQSRSTSNNGSTSTEKSSIDNVNINREWLSYDQLTGNSNPPSYFVDYSFMALPDDAMEPDIDFSGTFSLSNPTEYGFEVVEDWYGYGNNAERRYLPPISADIVSDGSHIIPVIRYNQRSSHPYWEYILSSGRIWKEEGDNNMIRAVIPFTLTQKNAQCAHNGLFMFLYNNDNDGTISKIWYQITQETCLYFKANYWGLLDAQYSYNTFIDNSIDPDTIKQGYLTEINNRIPIKSLSSLNTDYPEIMIDPTKFASSDDGLTAEQITMNGVYYNDVHYIGSYPTRSGEYPFPEQLIVPSYSTGKTTFLGITAMYLQHKYNADDLFNTILDIDYSGPGSNRWSDVTNNDCIDMATGNYRFTAFMSDESLLAVENGFFLPESHAAKYQHATTYYNRRVSPGQTWVYHSSDHYLCGYGLKRYLRSKSGDDNADIHDEIYENVYKRIGCSDVLKETKRTYDTENQPFSSHGLFYTRDDIVKLAKFMNNDHGRIGLEQVLDLHQLRSSLQLTNDKGLSIGNADDEQNNAWYYNNGVWSARKLWTLRQCPVDIPLMRGYGGIHVSMYPNGATYYYFNDNNEKEWLVAANEINKLQPSFC